MFSTGSLITLLIFLGIGKLFDIPDYFVLIMFLAFRLELLEDKVKDATRAKTDAEVQEEPISKKEIFQIPSPQEMDRKIALWKLRHVIAAIHDEKAKEIEDLKKYGPKHI